MKSILVMGLPTSGKTTFANQLYDLLKPNVNMHNADEIRKEFNDWDFSYEGRKRQTYRMLNLKILDQKNNFHSILDFVCPLQEFREIVNPDIVVWLNTIKSSPYEDTNTIFEPPLRCDFTIIDFSQFNSVISNILLWNCYD